MGNDHNLLSNPLTLICLQLPASGASIEHAALKNQKLDRPGRVHHPLTDRPCCRAGKTKLPIYLREIAEVMVDPPVETITVQKARAVTFGAKRTQTLHRKNPLL